MGGTGAAGWGKRRKKALEVQDGSRPVCSCPCIHTPGSALLRSLDGILLCPLCLLALCVLTSHSLVLVSVPCVFVCGCSSDCRGGHPLCQCAHGGYASVCTLPSLQVVELASIHKVEVYSVELLLVQHSDMDTPHCSSIQPDRFCW